jgi:nitroreductase
MAGADIGIVLAHLMLAATTKGLGTCWIGFAQEALNSSKKNKQ